MVNQQQLTSIVNMNFCNEVIEFYKIFKNADKDKNGRLDINEFTKIFREQKKKNLAKGTLISINSDKNEKIDIYEFLSFLLETPKPFTGKGEEEDNKDYIERIKERNEEYSEYIKFSLHLQRHRSIYIRKLELSKKENDKFDNFDYFKTVFSKSNITNDYLKQPSAQKPAPRVARPTSSTSRARQRRQTQAPRRPVPPRATPPKRRPPPVPTFTSSSSSPSSQTPPQTPRTQISSNFISRKMKLLEIFKTKENELKDRLEEDKNIENVQRYIRDLCNNINDVKHQSINVNTHERDMLNYLYKINLFNTILLDPNFSYILKDKSFKLLLQDQHQANIDKHINGLCNDINNLIRRNNNNTTYNNKILEFCEKLKNFLELLKEIKDGIKRDLDKETLQEKYSLSINKSNHYKKNTVASLNTINIQNLQNELKNVDMFLQNNYIEPNLNHDNKTLLKNIVSEKRFLNIDIRTKKIKLEESFTQKEINALKYFYNKDAKRGSKIAQTFKKVLFIYLTNELYINRIFPDYEYLKAEEVYKFE